MLQDEKITGYFPETVDEDHLILPEDCYVIPDETAARYRDQLHIDGSAVDRLEIDVFYANIIIDCYSGDRRCILEALYNGVIRKTCDNFGLLTVTTQLVCLVFPSSL